MPRYTNFAEHAFGLDSDKARRINEILHDLDPRLSLRRIPEGDPAFAAGQKKTPPHTFGVYEEGVAAGLTPWVFTLAEMSIDERIVARVMLGDMTKETTADYAQKLDALRRAREAAELKQRMEWLEERREVALGIAKLSNTRSSFRHKVGEDDIIIGGDAAPRSARTFISHSGRAQG